MEEGGSIAEGWLLRWGLYKTAPLSSSRSTTFHDLLYYLFLIIILNACQVPYFSGVEVSELVAGEDFTLALVRRKEEETITPVAEEEEARPHCPLGLPLGEEDKGQAANLSLGEEDMRQGDNVPLGGEEMRRGDNDISTSKRREDGLVEAHGDVNLSQNTTSEEHLCESETLEGDKGVVIQSQSTAKVCDNLNASVGVDGVGGPDQVECSDDDRVESAGGDTADGSVKVESRESEMEVDKCDIQGKLELNQVQQVPVSKEINRENDKPSSLNTSKEEDKPSSLNTCRKPFVAEDPNPLQDCSSDTVSIERSGSHYLSSGLGLVEGFNRVWSSSVSLISGGSTAEAKSLDGEDRILGSHLHQTFKSSSEPPSSSTTFAEDDMELNWNVVPERERGDSRTSKFSLGHRKSSSHGSFPKHSTVKKPLDLGKLNLAGSKLEKREVWSWGSGRRGQLGQGDMLARPTPAVIASLVGVGVVRVSAGHAHALAVTASGRVYGWGDNSRGQACPTDRLAVVLSPALLGLPSGETVRGVGAGGMASLILTDSGKLFVLGSAGQDNTSRFQVIKKKFKYSTRS